MTPKAWFKTRVQLFCRGMFTRKKPHISIFPEHVQGQLRLTDSAGYIFRLSSRGELKHQKKREIIERTVGLPSGMTPPPKLTNQTTGLTPPHSTGWISRYKVLVIFRYVLDSGHWTVDVQLQKLQQTQKKGIYYEDRGKWGDDN